MAHKRGHNGSANDDPLAFGFNQKVYGDVVSQQVRLAKQTESLRKSQREAMAKELAAEIPGAWYPCQHLNPLNP